MKKKLCLLWMILILVCLSGCGKMIKEPENLQSGKRDWKEEGFAIDGQVITASELWVNRYVSWEHGTASDAGESSSLYYDGICEAVYGGSVSRLSSIINPPDIEAVYWMLEIYDTDMMNHATYKLTYEDLGIDPGNCKCGFLSGMNMIDQSQYVFSWETIDKDEQGRWYQNDSKYIFYNIATRESMSVDLYDQLVSHEILQVEPDIYPVIPRTTFACDGNGNIYTGLDTSEQKYLCVFDKNAELVIRYDTGANIVGTPFRTEENELVFPLLHEDNNVVTLLLADTDTREMKALANLPADGQRIKHFAGMQGDNVYYLTESGIVRWNIFTGQRVQVFDYLENGVEKNKKHMLLLGTGEFPCLRVSSNTPDETETDWIVELDHVQNHTRPTLSIYDMVNKNAGSNKLGECIGIRSERDRNTVYSCKTFAAYDEDAWTQTVMELLSDNGPDILYVSRERMELLHEKGVVLPLDEILPAEVMDDLLPGAVELGMVNGTLAGLPVNISAYGMAVSSEIWDKDTWRIEDMTGLMQDKRLIPAIYYVNDYFMPVAAANLITSYNLQNSFLIDWERGTSHFGDERMVSFFKQIDINTSGLDRSQTGWLGEADRAAFFVIAGSGAVSSFGVETAGENCNYVGIPTEGSCGNYIDTDGVIVVNKAAAHKEEIKEFLTCLLGREIQEKMYSGVADDMSVRKIDLADVTEDEDGTLHWKGHEVVRFKDDTNSVEKAKAYLELCTAAPLKYEGICAIIQEELAAGYSDNRKWESVAANIDKRIELYLNE